MPNYKGHLVGGIMTYVFFIFLAAGVLYPSHLTACEWLFFTLAGALFPDIDVKSKGQKYFYHCIFLFFIVLVIQEQFHMLTCCSFIIIIPMLVKHRGFFHSPRFLIAMPLLVWFCISMAKPHLMQAFFYNTIFFIAGALSHILLDFGPRQMMYRMISRSKKSRR